MVAEEVDSIKKTKTNKHKNAGTLYRDKKDTFRVSQISKTLSTQGSKSINLLFDKSFWLAC